MEETTKSEYDNLQAFGSSYDPQEQEIMMKKEKEEMARLDKLRVKRAEEDEKKKGKIDQGKQEFAKWNE
jgi:hypothetical protein